MPTKVDGRPYQIDVTANPSQDSRSILLTGWPATYLNGAVATAPIWNLGTTSAAGAAWTVAINTATPSITLSCPQEDVALIGVGRYEWTLLLELADGSEPAIIGGAFTVSRSNRRTTTATALSVDVVPAGATVTIEQVLADGLSVIDGGVPAATGSESVDGGAP